jgi:regulator of sirC expression with transglutaminase-like and TPR domain
MELRLHYFLISSVYLPKINRDKTARLISNVFQEMMRQDSIRSYNINSARWDDDLEEANQMLAQNPSDEHHIKRGDIYIFRRAYQLAINDFDAALEINPNNTDALRKRGNARFLNGDKKGGCADLRKAASMGDEKAKLIIKESCKGY